MDRINRYSGNENFVEIFPSFWNTHIFATNDKQLLIEGLFKRGKKFYPSSKLGPLYFPDEYFPSILATIIYEGTKLYQLLLATS